MTAGIERRRTNKKERLSLDKFPNGIVNGRIDFPHGEPLLFPILASPFDNSQ
jgi:hypothetical protein